MSEAQLQRAHYVPRVGDVVLVDGHRVGDTPRIGEVLEVLGTPDHARYRVRWADGAESIFYPGDDAIIRPASESAAT